MAPRTGKAKLTAMSTACLEYDRVEEEKKSASSVYTDQLKALRGEMRQLAGQIRKKGVERPVDCAVQFHTPDVGNKTIIRMDTGEMVKVEPMSAEERQDNLFDELDSIERMYNAPDAREQEPPQADEQQPGQ